MDSEHADGVFNTFLKNSLDADKVQAPKAVGRFPSNVIGDITGHEKYFYCPKVSSKERGEGNNHTCLKPVALLEYMIKLVTPPGGTVLDPFNGSGSTGIAAVINDYDYIGVELDEKYVDISNIRIEAWLLK